MKKRFELIGVFLLGLITYSVRIFNYTISIDTERILNDVNSIMTEWIELNRFSLVFMKNIFNLVLYNVFLTNLFTLIIFSISIIIWIIVLEKVENKNSRLANFCFGGILITTPILAEQFSFTLQSLEIALAFLLMSINFLILEFYFESNKKLFLIISIILSISIFGCYQAFVILFMTISLFLSIIRYKDGINKKITQTYSLVFVISTFSYFIISIIVKYIWTVSVETISERNAISEYISQYMVMGKVNFVNMIYIILMELNMVLFGYGLENNITFLLMAMIFILEFKKTLKCKENKIYYIELIILMLSPFVFIFLYGYNDVIRSRFSLIFLTAFMTWHLIANHIEKLEKIVIFISLYTICLQFIVTFALFYSDYLRYQEDVELANQINIQLQNYDTSKPVIFVGAYNPTNVPIKGECLGYSFFEWDLSTEYMSNKRAIGFMKTLGFNYYIASIEQIKKAKKEAESIEEIFPSKSSIVETEDYIIIKMGEKTY